MGGKGSVHLGWVEMGVSWGGEGRVPGVGVEGRVPGVGGGGESGLYTAFTSILGHF